VRRRSGGWQAGARNLSGVGLPKVVEKMVARVATGIEREKYLSIGCEFNTV
jgi:hypothetical protein